MHEIWKMIFRKERLVAYFILMAFMKFNTEQSQFWTIGLIIAIILDKFENSIRIKYNDTTKDKIIRLIEEEDDENIN